MKRCYIYLLLACCCAASLLVTRAAAADDEINVATGDALMCITTYSSTVTNQGLFSQSFGRTVSDTTASHTLRVSLPVSIQGNHTYVYTLTWDEEYDSLSSYVSVTDFFDYVRVSRGTSYVDYDISNEIEEFDGFSMYRSVSSLANSSGYLRHVSVSFVVDDTTITDFTFFTQSHKIHKVQTVPINIIDISDATLDDVVSELVKLKNAQSSNSSNVADTLYDAILNLGTQISEDSWQNNEALKATMSEVKQAVSDMQESLPGAVEEGITSALEKEFDKFSKMAEEKLNEALEEIKAAIPVDITVLESSVSQVYEAVSSHSMDCIIELPAGTVSLMGETYTFWEAHTINLGEVRNIPGMDLLFLPVRFTFVTGFLYFMLKYFEEILDISLLNSGVSKATEKEVKKRL